MNTVNGSGLDSSLRQAESNNDRSLKRHDHSHHNHRSHHDRHDQNRNGVSVQAESIQVTLSASYSKEGSSATVDMDVFYQKLSAKMGLPPQDRSYAPNESGFTRIEPISPQQAAGNILSFVESRLASEAANGASQEKLAGLLEQARAGVLQGYGEAKEQLEGLGMMTDKLSDEIGQSFSLVDEGLGKLEEKYLGTVTPPVDEVAIEQPVSNSSQLPNGSPVNSQYSAGYEKEVGFDEELNLQVRTRDGDIVSISLRETGVSSEKMSYDTNGRSEQSSYEKSVYFSGEYSYEVEGDLDEGELAALNELFGQVNEVADLFFDGDFQEAFASAADMGFDSSELSSFSLNMTQTQMSKVSAYEDFSGQQSGRHALEPLGRVVAPAAKAFEALDQLTQDMSVLLDTLDHMMADKLHKQADAGPSSSLLENYKQMVGELLNHFSDVSASENS